nr:MAG TPA: hypothetical protein [Caudoviricetes sp.]
MKMMKFFKTAAMPPYFFGVSLFQFYFINRN